MSKGIASPLYFRPPEEITFDERRAHTWNRFKCNFLCFIKATGIAKQADDVQVASLLNLIGEEGRDIYSTFKWLATENKDKLSDVMKKFDDYCQPMVNVVYERYRFFTRTQREGESVDEYLTDLRLLMKTCEFATTLDIEDSLLRDKLVTGCLSHQLRERLLREMNIPLSNALSIAHASELSRQQIHEMEDKKTNIDAVDIIRKQSSPLQCTRCGQRHNNLSSCPATGKQCFKCQKTGHFSRCCRSNNSKSIRHIAKDISNEGESSISWLSINTIASDRGHNDMWTCDVSVFGVHFSLKIDSGADVNVIPLQLYRQLNRKTHLPMLPTNKKLHGYNNVHIPVEGRVCIPLVYRSVTHNIDTYIANCRSPPILGKPGIAKLSLLQRVLSIQSTKTVQDTCGPFSEVPGRMPGRHKILLRNGAIPIIQSPRKFPFSVQDDLRNEIDRLERLHLIEPVTHPTPWVHQIAIVVKKDSSLRICLDPRQLNPHIIREQYHLPTADEIFNRMQGAKVFSFLDATQGFHHVVLDEESSLLTTFNTPFGRYKWLRMPFGISSASEVFHRKMVECLHGIDGVEVFIDDIAVWGRNEEEHDHRLQQVLERCKKKGIHLNRKKCRINVREAKYLGHILSHEGLKADPEKIQAISEMPIPKSKEDIHCLLGMVNYLSKFIPNCASKTNSLRQLLRKDQPFEWGAEQQAAFQELIRDLSSSPTLALYDPTKPLVMSVDASQNGLGACLWQEDHPIAYASCSLTRTQQKYAQIEKEMLAIVFGCRRFYQFIWGRSCTIVTDHKPLESIACKSYSNVSPRLLKMLLKIQHFDLKVVYKPGKEIPVADNLSRNYLTSTSVGEELEASLEAQVLQLQESFSMAESSWNAYQQATAKDEELQEVIKCVEEGWPKNKKDLHSFSLGKYWSVREDLYVHGNIVFRGRRIVVPKELRKSLLTNMHLDHGGISKTMAKAREAVYWPGMNEDITRTVENCYACQVTSRKNQSEPMMPGKLPDYPFQVIGLDYFEENGAQYIVIVDAYSHWFDLYPASSTQFKVLQDILFSHFAKHGIPEKIISDNGPPFHSHQYKEFCVNHDIKSVTSSPKYPQSNGLAERSVQTAKKMIRRCRISGNSLLMALMEYRNAPFAANLPSPSEMALGRKIRTKFPYQSHHLTQHFHSLPDVVKQYEAYKDQQKKYFDQGTRPLSDFQNGDSVLIADGSNWVSGQVINKLSYPPRSYMVRLKTGTILRRNRKHLKKLYKEDLSTMQVPKHENNSISPNVEHGDQVMESRYGRRIVPPLRYGFS